MSAAEIAPDAWWCDEHREIHLGRLTSWSMEHRLWLHPLRIERRHKEMP